MTVVSPQPVSGGRILAAIPSSDVKRVLSDNRGRPIAALLALQGGDVQCLEPAIDALLDAGCDYFVCSGSGAEPLHDRVDDLVVRRVPQPERSVTTTWHSDESISEVLDFFFDVAASKEGTLMVAVLGPSDTELARELHARASA